MTQPRYRFDETQRDRRHRTGRTRTSATTGADGDRDLRRAWCGRRSRPVSTALLRYSSDRPRSGPGGDQQAVVGDGVAVRQAYLLGVPVQALGGDAQTPFGVDVVPPRQRGVLGPCPPEQCLLGQRWPVIGLVRLVRLVADHGQQSGEGLVARCLLRAQTGQRGTGDDNAALAPQDLDVHVSRHGALPPSSVHRSSRRGWLPSEGTPVHRDEPGLIWNPLPARAAVPVGSAAICARSIRWSPCLSQDGPLRRALARRRLLGKPMRTRPPTALRTRCLPRVVDLRNDQPGPPWSGRDGHGLAHRGEQVVGTDGGVGAGSGRDGDAPRRQVVCGRRGASPDRVVVRVRDHGHRGGSGQVSISMGRSGGNSGRARSGAGRDTPMAAAGGGLWPGVAGESARPTRSCRRACSGRPSSVRVG